VIKFHYINQPPKRYTFEQPKLKQLVESYCEGKVLNLFAGYTRLNIDEIRVDMDSTTEPDFLMDAYDFVSTWKGSKFQTIILDPPYNVRKAREKYAGRYIGKFKKIKEHIPYILNPGGSVITLGYDSVGMSRSRGFKKEVIILVCHNGDHNDTICVIERLIQPSLFNSAYNVPHNNRLDVTGGQQ
jgi:hypothetical protein